MVEPTTKEAGPSPNPLTVLPIGSSRTLLYRGGPHPWVGKPSFYFSDGSHHSLLLPFSFTISPSSPLHPSHSPLHSGGGGL